MAGAGQQPKRLALAVAELARFALFPVHTGERGGHWRAVLGTHWHQTLRQQLEQTEVGWEFEVAVEGTLWQGDWCFQLRGRVDQLHRGESGALVREVKSIRGNLPQSEEALRASYPEYFYQVMLYAYLLGHDGVLPEAELLFVEIGTGLSQTVRIGGEDWRMLYQHLAEVAELLEHRHCHQQSLRGCAIPDAFAELRPGQSECREELRSAWDAFTQIHFEAPTGFGKTGLALEQALCLLVTGEANRVVLLTGKNTGHDALITQAESFRRAMPHLRVLPIRSRNDLLLEGEDPAYAPPADDLRERWQRAGFQSARILDTGVPRLEQIKQWGQAAGIPPWMLLRMLMPEADIWIADYNYLFDPDVSGMFTTVPGYVPSKTVLVIDEAHNLPERVGSMHSHTFARDELRQLLTELQMGHFSGSLPRCLDRFISALARLQPVDELDPPDGAALLDLLRAVAETLPAAGMGVEELDAGSWQMLNGFAAAVRDWQDPRLQMLAYVPARGQLSLACLDAAEVIADTVRPFCRVMYMSATLQPWPEWYCAIGAGEAQSTRVVGEAPWLAHCFSVWVDARVDTRFRQRDHYVPLIADTIVRTAETANGCLPVFFPSYAFAEKVLQELTHRHCHLRCQLQPRNADLETQLRFLETTLLLDDALLLVLGSRFSEGIDFFGGRVEDVIIVSPALPEFNPIQQARERLVDCGRDLAFKRIYLVPGLRKISQALGRMVRAPDHKARVLLQCQRFAAPLYQELLPSYLRASGYLYTDEDFDLHWWGG